MDGLFQYTLMILIFVSPAAILPLILGPIILRVFREDEISSMAGLLTLKPLLATPLWAFIIALGSELDLPGLITQLLSIVPGIGLTLLIVWKFRALFGTQQKIAFVLLAVDAMRWLNSFAAFQFGHGAGDFYYWLGLILPNAYAILVLAILWIRQRQFLQPAEARS